MLREVKSYKSQRSESNRQPPHYECGALPIEATLAWREPERRTTVAVPPTQPSYALLRGEGESVKAAPSEAEMQTGATRCRACRWDRSRQSRHGNCAFSWAFCVRGSPSAAIEPFQKAANAAFRRCDKCRKSILVNYLRRFQRSAVGVGFCFVRGTAGYPPPSCRSELGPARKATSAAEPRRQSL